MSEFYQKCQRKWSYSNLGSRVPSPITVSVSTHVLPVLFWVSRWIGYDRLSPGVNEHVNVCMCMVLQWTGVPSKLFSLHHVQCS